MSTFNISEVILVQEASASDMGVSYEREVLSEETLGEREETLFKTLRVFENKPEALRAKAVYEQARARLRKLCSKTVIGLVCPVAREAELAETISELDRMVAEANAEFRTCRIEYTVVPVRIEHDNARAHETLRREIQRHAERLIAATSSADAEGMRRALKAGKGLEQLVADESVRRDLEGLNEAARAAARVITRSIKEHEGDVEQARTSVSVRAAAEAVARRFPWADAFGVSSGSCVEVATEEAAA